MLYFKQEKDYTCGCASLRMAMSNFILYRFLPTEAELEQEMGTNDRIGTHPDAIIAAAEKRGFLAKKGEGASFEDIQAMMSDGWIVNDKCRCSTCSSGSRDKCNAYLF
jgi:predicted double-glycine peptidase